MAIAPHILKAAAKYARRTSTYQAEEKFGITRTTIRRTMKRLGLPRRRAGNYDTYKPSTRRRAISLVLSGKTPAETSLLTGIPADYVRKLVNNHRKLNQ